MVKRKRRTMAWVGLILPVLGFGQQSCPNGIRVDGLITDSTGAVIPRANVQTGSGMSTVTDTTGHYVLAVGEYGELRVAVARLNPSAHVVE
jgi:hypothetical protein